MLTIEEKKIYFTRGDTGFFAIGLSGYDYGYDDKLIFTLKREIGGDVLVQKEIRVGETFQLNPEDTRDLEYGKYWYDIELHTPQGYIFTIIEKTAFYLREEVNTYD